MNHRSALLYEGSRYAYVDHWGNTGLNRAIRDMPPGPDAVRLTGTHFNGSPDGVHTGGPWLYQEEIWKPLDGQAGPNQNHYPTIEADALSELSGMAFIPNVFRFEVANSRAWIVRPYAHMVGGDKVPFDRLKTKDLLALETAILDINQRGWELNEYPQLAITPTSNYQMHMIDFSACIKHEHVTAYWQHDDHDMFLRWLSEIPNQQAKRLAAMRYAGMSVSHELMLEQEPLRYVYGSYHRPAWLGMDVGTVAKFITPAKSPATPGYPYSWIATATPIASETVASLELDLAWFPRFPDKSEE